MNAIKPSASVLNKQSPERVRSPAGNSLPLVTDESFTNKEYRFTSQNTTSIMDIYFI